MIQHDCKNIHLYFIFCSVIVIIMFLYLFTVYICQLQDKRTYVPMGVLQLYVQSKYQYKSVSHSHGTHTQTESVVMAISRLHSLLVIHCHLVARTQHECNSLFLCEVVCHFSLAS